MVCSNKRLRAPPAKPKEQLARDKTENTYLYGNCKQQEDENRIIRKSRRGADNVERWMRILESGCGCRDGVCTRREKMYAAVSNGVAIGVYEQNANAWFRDRCGDV